MPSHREDMGICHSPRLGHAGTVASEMTASPALLPWCMARGVPQYFQTLVVPSRQHVPSDGPGVASGQGGAGAPFGTAGSAPAPACLKSPGSSYLMIPAHL